MGIVHLCPIVDGDVLLERDLHLHAVEREEGSQVLVQLVDDGVVGVVGREE